MLKAVIFDSDLLDNYDESPLAQNRADAGRGWWA